MSFAIETTQRGDCLCVYARGVRSLSAVTALAEEVVAYCVRDGKDRVLVNVSGLEGALTFAEILTLVTVHFRTLRGLRAVRAAAIVDATLTGERHVLLETLAVNRGYNFRIFDAEDGALAWLQQGLADAGDVARRVD